MFGLSKIIRPFFSNVFMAINIDSNICYIKVLRLKESKVVEEFDREFRILDDELPIEMIKFIKNYKRRFPFSYIGVISKTYNQGIFNTKKIDELHKIGIEPTECKILKFKDWCAYIKKTEILEMQKYFSRFGGVDYVFSPFVLMFFSIQNKIDDKLRLYVLCEKSNIALFVANKNNAYFGGYFMIEGEIEQVSRSSTLGTLENQNTQDKDQYSLEEFENLDLGFIQEEEEEDQEIEQIKNVSQTVDDIAKASVIANVIQSSLNEFYANEFYDEGFVEEVVCLDSFDMTSEMVACIQDITMLEVSRQQFFLQEELLSLTQREFRGR